VFGIGSERFVAKMQAVRSIVVGSIVLLGAREAQAQQDWSYEVVPYLWTSSLDGEEGPSGNTVEVDAGFSDLVEFVNTGLSVHFEARRAPLTWFAEASYVELGDDVDTRIGKLEVTSAQTFLEGGLAYDLQPSLAVYGGLRFQDLDTDLDLAGHDLIDDSQSWVDGIVGLRWKPLVTDTWVAWARGDVGAGGSDLTWLAEAGAGYRWGTRWGAYLVYRILDTDYENDDFVYDVRQSGLLLGFGIRF
jgi:hypothetical protein